MRLSKYFNELKTKKILSIFFGLAIGLVLTFTVGLGNLSASNGLPVDWFVATTNLREANSYRNNSKDKEWKIDSSGNYIRWAVNKEYYNLTNGELEDYDGTIYTSYDGNPFATLNDYYTFDGTKVDFTKNFDSGKIYRYDNNGKLDPMGNYIDDAQQNPITGLTGNKLISNQSSTVKILSIDGIRAYIEVPNSNKDNPDTSNDNILYSLNYTYGYNYKDFADGYVSIAGDNYNTSQVNYLTANENAAGSPQYTLQYGTAQKTGEADITLNIGGAAIPEGYTATYQTELFNRYLLTPTTTIGEGSVIFFNNNWHIIQYCESDGTKAEPNKITEYIALPVTNDEKEHKADKFNIWAKLNTSTYYVRNLAGVAKEWETYNADAKLTMYAYRLSTGLWNKDNDKYTAIKKTNKIQSFNNTIYSVANSDLLNSKLNVIDSAATDQTQSVAITPSNSLYISEYYYQIYRAIKDGDKIIGYELYSNELKSQSNYNTSGDNAIINTYFANDKLSDLYYYNGTGYTPVFSKTFANNADETIAASESSTILLDNYNQQKNIFGKNNDSEDYNHLDNIYLGFGDIYYAGKNDNSDNLLTSLSVTIKLYNTYYNGVVLAINEPILQEVELTINGEKAKKNNYYWFQYLDLKNTRYYTNQRKSETAVVEESAGRYEITISYGTYTISSDVDYSGYTDYIYNLYVDETSNKATYPVISNADLQDIATDPKSTGGNYMQYYYNFQKRDIPQIVFDASEYAIEYTYNYGQYSLDYYTQFKTYSRPSIKQSETIDYTGEVDGKDVVRKVYQTNKLVEEYSLLDIYKSGYVNNVLQTGLDSRRQISAKAYILDTDGMYYYGTDGAPEKITNASVYYKFGDGDEYNFSKAAIIQYTYRYKAEQYRDNTDYLDNPNYGEFERAVTIIVGQTVDDYIIYQFETTSEAAAAKSWIKSNSFDGNKYTIAIEKPADYSVVQFKELDDNTNPTNVVYKNNKTIEVGTFDAEKYYWYFNNDSFNFDYDVKLTFEELGQYQFVLSYATSNASVRSTSTSGGTAYGITYGTNTYSAYYNKTTKADNNIDIKPLTDTERDIIFELKNKTKTIKASDNTALDEYSMGRYYLAVFGVKSYFNKYNPYTQTTSKTDFRNVTDGIYGDITADVISKLGQGQLQQYTTLKEYIEAYTSKVGLMEDGQGTNNYKTIAKVPNTNQTPITFDYLCNYAYTGTRSNSRIYWYKKFTYNSDGTCTVTGTPEVRIFDKDSRPYQNGYYTIVTEYKYPDSQSDTRYQIFAFVIDNAAPKITYSTLKENIVDETNKYRAWESIDSNAYTNSAVRATWRTANYFQYEVTPYISKNVYDNMSLSYGSASQSNVAYPLLNETKSIYTINTKYSNAVVGKKIDLGSGTIGYNKANNQVEYKGGTDREYYYVTTYSNPNLKVVPYFKININGDTITEERLSKLYSKYITEGSEFSTADFYNVELLEMLDLALENGLTINFELVSYQWQLTMYPTSTYSDEFGNNITGGTGSVWGSGDYYLKLVYGSSASSSNTSRFHIDTLPIDKITTKAVAQINNSYQIIGDFDANPNMLINSPFTLTYNRKSSGAEITTNYYTIPLTALADNSNSVKLLLDNGLIGISTNNIISVNNNIPKKKYNYKHNYNNLNDVVPSTNVLYTDASALYVFELTDAAGNTARYYVIYDNTNPICFTELSEKDNGKTHNQLYNIITDTTKLFWGNYKSIEVTQDKLDIDYIKNVNGHINYQPTALEQTLRHLNYNSSAYLGATFAIYWEIDNEWTEVAYRSTSDRKELLNKLTIDEDKKVTLGDNNLPKERYFINIPLGTVNFTYKNNNSNDTSEKTYVYNMQSVTTNGTTLYPSKIKSAVGNGLAATEADVTDVMLNIIANNIGGSYGFFGENSYIYKISDVLGNNCSNSYWMNLDMTLAFAWGLFENSSYELSNANKLNIRNIEPNSAYSASQMYFSYLNNTSDNQLPTTDFAYKYYPFDSLDTNGFYNNYSIKDITSNEKNIYNITFGKLTYDDSNNATWDADEIKYTIDLSEKNNLNQDKENVTELLSSYPFSLLYSSGNSANNGWQSISSNNLSNYKNVEDTNRIFTELINEQDPNTTSANENLPNGKYTTAGLYIFRRVYTEYVNKTIYNSTGKAFVDTSTASEISDKGDTVVRYYAYYIDRYSIIDVTNLIGSDISIVLGDYIQSATKDSKGNIIYNTDYSTNITASQIYTASTNGTSVSAYSYKDKKLASPIDTSKPYVSINMPLDKYNQTKLVNSAIDKRNIIIGNADPNLIWTSDLFKTLYNDYFNADIDTITEQNKNALYNEFLSKYVFGITSTTNWNNGKYYNDMFRLSVDMTSTDSNATALISDNEIKTFGRSNLYQSAKVVGSLSTTSSNSRLNLTNYDKTDLTSLIVRKIMGYNIVIKDRAGYSYSDGTNYLTANNNQYTLDINISGKKPSGSLLTKETSANYYTNNNSDIDYASALFVENGDLGRLKNLNSNNNVYNDINSNSLIFLIDNTTIDRYTAVTNPYQIVINKTDSSNNTTKIFESRLTFALDNNGNYVPTYSYVGDTQIGNTDKYRMATAFMDNSSIVGTPTKWAIVVYDNNSKDTTYHNLLSNALDNATYTITIQHYGTISDYPAADNNSTSHFSETYSITVDHIKPLYNIIRLMEQDITISNPTIPNNAVYGNRYSNIDDYVETLMTAVNDGRITNLQAQQYIKAVYDRYITTYQQSELGQSFILSLTDQFGEDELFFNNYFFTINSGTYEWKRAVLDISDTGTANYYGQDNSGTLYFRQIGSNDADLVNYKFSVTVDDFTAITNEKLLEHSIFVQSSAQKYNSGTITPNTFYYIDDIKETQQLFSNFANGYYEIIERDVAGNYQVYLIHLANSANRYKANYTDKNGESIENIIINSTNSDHTGDTRFVGKDLQILNNGNILDYNRIDITYSFINARPDGTTTTYNNHDNPIRLYNDLFTYQLNVYQGTNAATYSNIDLGDWSLSTTLPSSDATSTLTTRLNDILNYIAQKYGSSALDFDINITIYDRLGGKYLINYATPGKELKPTATYTTTGIRLTIPNDSVGRITKLVWIAGYGLTNTNGTIQWSDNAIDSKGSIENKTSIGGQSIFLTYQNGVGYQNTFKVQTKDTFGNVNTYLYSKPNETQYNIKSGTTQTYNDKTYTAKDIEISYLTPTYNTIILENHTIDSTKTALFFDIENDKYSESAYIVHTQVQGADIYSVYNSTSVHTSDTLMYTITRAIINSMPKVTIKQEKGYECDFDIVILDKRNNEDYTSNKGGSINPTLDELLGVLDKNEVAYVMQQSYTMYTKLPDIQITNRSNMLLNNPDNQIYIEEVKYSVVSGDYLFTPTLSITKDGVGYVATNNTLSQDGKYQLTISNALGYSKTIKFEINTEYSTYDYMVYRVNANNSRDALQRSKTISTVYTDDDVSDYQFTNNNLQTGYKGRNLYHFYTLTSYYNYTKQGNNWLAGTTGNRIELVINTNNKIAVTLVGAESGEENQNTKNYGQHALYKVTDSDGSIVELFVIHFIKSNTTSDLADTTINSTPNRNTSDRINSNIINRKDDTLYILFANTYNTAGNNDAEYMKGNTLTLLYSYNNVLTETIEISKLLTIVEDGTTYYYYEISDTGVHKFEIVDLAGNRAYYGSTTKTNSLNIYLVNGIMYTINGSDPIPNFITNDNVRLKILNTAGGRQLYTINQDITILKNDSEYIINPIATNEYEFTESGTYVIEVRGNSRNETTGAESQVSTRIEFTIVNQSVAYNSYAISSAKGFVVQSILRKLENTETSRETALTSYNGQSSLLISCEDDYSGAGYYTITLSKYLSSIKKDKTFTFRVWLNNRSESTIIIPSIPFGTATTDVITLKYNLGNIYSNVGESYITINDEIIETINADSLNEAKTYEITERGEYWIKIVSANGQILASYKLTKNDPLNTTAVIIIIVSVIFVALLAVIFIILRRKTKFR